MGRGWDAFASQARFLAGGSYLVGKLQAFPPDAAMAFARFLFACVPMCSGGGFDLGLMDHWRFSSAGRPGSSVPVGLPMAGGSLAGKVMSRALLILFSLC